MATDTVIGPWSFRFRGDYCICDEDNCNHAGIVKAGYFGTLFGGVVLLLRNIITIWIEEGLWFYDLSLQ